MYVVSDNETHCALLDETPPSGSTLSPVCLLYPVKLTLFAHLFLPDRVASS